MTLGWKGPVSGSPRPAKEGVVQDSRLAKVSVNFNLSRIQCPITVLGHNKFGNSLEALPLLVFQELIVFRRCR